MKLSHRGPCFWTEWLLSTRISSLLTSTCFSILWCLPLLAAWPEGSPILEQRQVHLSLTVCNEEQLPSMVVLGTAKHLQGLL